MRNLTRREFLQLSGLIAAAAGLSSPQARAVAAGLDRLARGLPRVAWLQGQSCSGCSISLLNSEQPGPAELLTEYISLVFHQNVGAAQGADVGGLLKQIGDAGDFILVVEGSIPAAMPEACLIAGRPVAEWVLELAPRALAVMAAGTCAAYGGIPAAEGNATGATGVADFLRTNGIDPRGRVINCPSCPTHPNTMVGTLAYTAAQGYPPVDSELLTPKMFYSHSTHDDCPRFHYYSKHVFAEKFGDQEGCLFKLGCLGPLTFTECPRRQWNGGVNWCIRASAPCVGCSSPHFARYKNFPFYRKGEQFHTVGYGEDDRLGGSS
ncbi:MAG TPA: hydrogenase small subunit [Candidatus Krumholzibacteria bacterium]|nr:hydrogenase small subunit [Candidatus Krumholzibacteria bacterium]HPD70331.1 hydrogenase small subunit [Candidatus Krumholzibacteria bacterium]HRY39969.1 hydrogenase small subunit [Candidatus Krumholzibacteria bacterium]